MAGLGRPGKVRVRNESLSLLSLIYFVANGAFLKVKNETKETANKGRERQKIEGKERERSI